MGSQHRKAKALPSQTASLGNLEEIAGQFPTGPVVSEKLAQKRCFLLARSFRT